MSILASKSQGKGGPDPIFAISDMAKVRAEEVGAQNIVNATIGSFLDSEGRLVTLKSVEEAMRSLDFSDACDYAPIAGLPRFIDAAIDAAFLDCRPEAYLAGMATPGGTGGLHNAFYNYLEEGDTCITTDRYWGNYASLLDEIGRKLDTFNTFDGDKFDIKACLAKVHEYAAKQKNMMLLLNTPAHNPTGFSVTDDEWQILIKELSAVANNGVNNVILVIDVAYIDFAGPHGRDFFKLFTRLPDNFLVIVTFSMSKGYTLYGYRLGCMIGISSSQETIEEFKKANAYSSRATWSNCNRAAMLTMIEFADHPEKQAIFKAEQEDLRLSLVKRAETFITEANAVDLPICPYQAGFFITVPTKDVQEAQEIAAIMREDDIFVVPLGAGLRVAICAIPEEKITGMAAKFKEAFKRLEK